MSGRDYDRHRSWSREREGWRRPSDRAERERSRSRDRDRFRKDDEDRDRDRRRGHERERDYRENDARRDRGDRGRSPNRQFEQDSFGRTRDASGRSTNTAVPKPSSAQTSRATAEQIRQERLAIVRNLTGAGDALPVKKDKLASKAKDRGRGSDGQRNEVADDNSEGEVEVDEDNDDDIDIEEVLGFAGFGSTKGKAVTDNLVGPAAGAVSKHKARKYRQYMNRKGGFNRPLQKMD